MVPTYTEEFKIRVAPLTAAKLRDRARQRGSTVSELVRAAIRLQLEEAA